MQTYQADADSTLGALTENVSRKTVEGKKKKKQNEVPVVQAAEVGNYTVKEKNKRR
jgi:isochorismate hydrolase